MGGRMTVAPDGLSSKRPLQPRPNPARFFCEEIVRASTGITINDNERRGLAHSQLRCWLTKQKFRGERMAKEIWTGITAEITVNGSYSVSEEDRTITVKSPYGSKTTGLGGLRPEVLAKFMLREPAQDER